MLKSSKIHFLNCTREDDPEVDWNTVGVQ